MRRPVPKKHTEVKVRITELKEDRIREIRNHDIKPIARGIEKGLQLKRTKNDRDFIETYSIWEEKSVLSSMNKSKR